MLDRTDAVPALLGDVTDTLIIAGLGNAVFDIAHLTDDSPTAFPLDGVMGAAVSLGLGLALTRPDRDVLVVTGDGELLMNVGALATAAFHDPPNLSILCVDNGVYALTGGQAGHTSRSTDIEVMARGAGIASTVTVREASGLAAASEILWSRAGVSLVVAKVAPGNSPSRPVERNGVACRLRFRAAVGDPDAG